MTITWGQPGLVVAPPPLHLVCLKTLWNNSVELALEHVQGPGCQAADLLCVQESDTGQVCNK